MTPLSVDNLYAMDDSSLTGVGGSVRNCFRAQLQVSPSVHETFFATAASPAAPPADPAWTDNVAVAMVCSSLSRSSLYGFSGTVRQSNADAYWTSQLNGSAGLRAGRAIYDALFPYQASSSGVTFQNYLSSTGGWGAQLADRLKSDDYINIELNEIVAGGGTAKINLLLYMLHRLDQSQESAVLAAWQAAYPAISETWQATALLPASYFQNDEFLQDVNNAIAVGTIHVLHTPRGAEFGAVLSSYWTSYGAAVADWVGSNAVTNLGLSTGASPSNFSMIAPGGEAEDAS